MKGIALHTISNMKSTFSGYLVAWNNGWARMYFSLAASDHTFIPSTKCISSLYSASKLGKSGDASYCSVEVDQELEMQVFEEEKQTLINEIKREANKNMQQRKNYTTK